MEDLEAVNLAADWADISQGLRKDLGHQLHSQWIKPIQVGGFTDDTGTLELYLPTDFSANWVKDRFHDRLSLAWKIAAQLGWPDTFARPAFAERQRGPSSSATPRQARCNAPNNSGARAKSVNASASSTVGPGFTPTPAPSAPAPVGRGFTPTL